MPHRARTPDRQTPARARVLFLTRASLALDRHAARRAALQQAAAHFEASAAPGAASKRSSRADAHRSLEEVLYQLGDHDGARRAHAAFVARSPKDGLRARRRVPCARVREALAQAEERV